MIRKQCGLANAGRISRPEGAYGGLQSNGHQMDDEQRPQNTRRNAGKVLRADAMTRPRPSEWAKLGTLLYWANRDGLLAACPEISDMGTRDPRRFDQFSDLNWSAVTLAYLALDALETC